MTREVKWRYLGQFSVHSKKQAAYSPLIFICGIFIVSNHRFIVVYHGLSLIAVHDGLRIQR